LRDAKRILGERLQPHLAAHTVRGADLRDADASHSYPLG
jgi:hypothetical protein